MEEPNEIYYGDRGENFVRLLVGLLKRAKLKSKLIEKLLDEEGMEVYSRAFTHKTVNEEDNYEFLELLGDSTVNKAVVWYLSRRFPNLNCPDGVKVIARLKINLVSKKTFADFGLHLNFWNFVTCDRDTRETKMRKTLEDVFEAFFGATELLLDRKVKLGAGYIICYNLIESLFNELPISLKYEDLFDAITRLKELFDYFSKPIIPIQEQIGKLIYENERIQYDEQHKIQEVKIFRAPIRGPRYLIGMARAPLLPDAKQKAAEIAITTLNRERFIKPIPEAYAKLCK